MEQKPSRVCNLGHRCPTPPMIFCHANTPTLENLYPKHHHREDHQCPRGAAHRLHCVFQFRTDSRGRESGDKTSCILPPTVQHQCCQTNAQPHKAYIRPTITTQLCGAGVVWHGRNFVVTGEREDDYSDLPVEVEGLPFAPERDLDEVERSSPEYRERAARAEEAARLINEVCDGGDCHGQSQQQQQQQQKLPGRGLGVPGMYCSSGPMYSHLDAPARLEPLGSAFRPIVVNDDEDDEKGTPDVFGDRHHHHVEDEMDLDG